MYNVLFLIKIDLPSWISFNFWLDSKKTVVRWHVKSFWRFAILYIYILFFFVKTRKRSWSWRAYVWWRVQMNVVTDVRTTQRTCKRTSGRTRDVRVDGRVRTNERTCERTYVRWHVHSSRARARTKIRSTPVGLISVRLNLPNTNYVRKNRDVQK